ncbi:tetraacyldisaccharide 4'-kinase [Methylophilus sp. OH31]|uniref:tetraacyldisaccharide 4'-kinase n=1 Tax=Methylophilus sp. OH31 TaxID=1387312 RepID=UPI000467D89E|nr:tetraacyldisaccharide 4'-kinase [Methylophilus sp. OH31]
MLRTWFERQWQINGWAQCLLLPLSWLFALLAAGRRYGYHIGLFSSQALPVPVIIVGNISVGGVGKTPLVIYLAQQLRDAGYVPGILSRGYGGQHRGEVRPESEPALCGDEPVLIARRTGCPVWVDPKRAAGGLALLKAHPEVNVLICDDGLQHYALQRDIEIAVVQRPLGIGNGRLLPAGPLRESLRRLRSVNLVVETGQLPATPEPVNTYQLGLRMGTWTSVADFSSETSTERLRGQSAEQTLVAMAGIGHPQRFFDLLAPMGLDCEQRPLADHYAYSQADFIALRGKTILMTEKDAVKCQHLGLENAWFLPMSAELSPVGHDQSLAESVIGLLKHKHAKEVKNEF